MIQRDEFSDAKFSIGKSAPTALASGAPPIRSRFLTRRRPRRPSPRQTDTVRPSQSRPFIHGKLETKGEVKDASRSPERRDGDVAHGGYKRFPTAGSEAEAAKMRREREEGEGGEPLSHTFDNLDLVSRTPTVLDYWVSRLEALFPEDRTGETIQYRFKKHDQVTFLFNKVLLPKTAILYNAVMCLVIGLIAHAGLTPTWTLLAWVLMEGFELYHLVKRIYSARTGLPYFQDIETAFVLNPKCETVSWLNVAVRALWCRCFQGFVRNSLRMCLNELLRRRLREWKKSYLYRFLIPDLTDLDLGTTAPWITAVESYVSEINLLGGSHETFTVDLGVVCTLRCNLKVTLFLHVMEIGIREVKFNAPMRIRFLPLLRDETVFGQLQISLLGVPTLEYETFGLLGFLSFPFVRKMMLSLLKEVTSFFCYPQKIIIPNPCVEKFRRHTIVPTRPLGLLRLHLAEAKNLKTQPNIGVFCAFVNRSDPYVIVRLGPQAEKTKVVRRESSPRWNHVFEFPINRQDYDFRELKFYALDFEWGFWTEDKPIGFTCISVKKIVAEGTYDHWYILGEGGEGKLHVQTQFVPILSRLPKVLYLTVSQDQRKSQAILSFLVFEVQMNHLCKPMVVLEVSGRKAVTSSHGQLSENWEFAEEFFIPVNDIKKDKLTLSLVDYDSKKSFRQATKRFCKTLQKFISESEDPQVVKTYNRGNHFLLGETIVDIDSGFTGQRQIINLHSDAGRIYRIIGIGRLYLLKNITVDFPMQSTDDIHPPYMFQPCHFHQR